jgi:hypothetical protein
MSTMPTQRAPLIGRRAFIGAALAPWLGGCSTPLPLVAAPLRGDSSAAQRLHESAEAHGLAAYRTIADINVSYSGEWRPLVGRIQPEVVDEGFRGSSQERLLPKAGIVAQAYTGAKGKKQVSWQRQRPGSGDLGEIAVWFNDVRSTDTDAQQAAALVAEGYGLFLLGPLWLVDRDLPVRSAGTEQVDGQTCDVVEVWLTPGLGLVAADRVALCIERRSGLMRRVRFTLEGFARTRGAVAEVDTFDHQRRFGVTWPMRSYERIVHPIALPAHDWRITGLDVDRGYGVDAVSGPRFTGAAAAPAQAL